MTDNIRFDIEDITLPFNKENLRILNKILNRDLCVHVDV